MGEDSAFFAEGPGHITAMKRLKNQTAAPKDRTLEVPLMWFGLLHISLLLNSMSGVMAKLAGRYDVLSRGFCMFYGLDLLFVFIQALVWQQVLKHMSLTFANMNRPISIIYSLIWSTFIFRETITPRMLLGALIIMAGIILGVSEKPAPPDRPAADKQEEAV